MLFFCISQKKSKFIIIFGANIKKDIEQLNGVFLIRVCSLLLCVISEGPNSIFLVRQDSPLPNIDKSSRFDWKFAYSISYMTMKQKHTGQEGMNG